MCSFSKEGEQEDVSLCGFAFANGEVGEEQSFASSMSAIGMLRQQRELVPKPRVEQKKKSAESMDSAQGLSICALSSDYAALATLRSDLKPARTSSENSCGCSQAAKWPPLSSLL